MSKKKIVTIEDRIPKLKQARKKKANRRLIFYLSIFFILISIVIYIQSPFSDVKNVHISGNGMVTDDQILSAGELDDEPNIWSVSTSDIKEQLEKYPIIQSVNVKRNFPQALDIHVEEYEVVGYIERDGNYIPITESGDTINEMKQKTMTASEPFLEDFTDDAYLSEMATELKELPKDIREMISEIHWKPADDNQNNILLYMNDGYVVDGVIRDFAEKMEVYPSIVAQLPEDEKGIIHIGAGAYFESFSSD